jgi:hypothetical protein
VQKIKKKLDREKKLIVYCIQSYKTLTEGFLSSNSVGVRMLHYYTLVEAYIEGKTVHEGE